MRLEWGRHRSEQGRSPEKVQYNINNTIHLEGQSKGSVLQGRGKVEGGLNEEQVERHKSSPAWPHYRTGWNLAQMDGNTFPRTNWRIRLLINCSACYWPRFPPPIPSPLPSPPPHPPPLTVHFWESAHKYFVADTWLLTLLKPAIWYEQDCYTGLLDMLVVINLECQPTSWD